MTFIPRNNPHLWEFFTRPWNAPDAHDYQFSIDPLTHNLLKTCTKCGKRPVNLFTIDMTTCKGANSETTDSH